MFLSHGLVVSGANIYDAPTDHAITRLGTKLKDDVIFMSSSYALCQRRASVLS